MRRSLILLIALIAGGCATTPPAPTVAPEQAWASRQEALSELRLWQLSGRISVQTGEEAAHGSLRWLQEGNRYDIRITGPFGSGTVRLAGDPSDAALWVDRQTPIHSSDPEMLLYQQTGWWIPVDALRYWIVGLPAPSLASERKLDAYGRLETLHQAGWEIRFLDYEKREGLDLPGRVFVAKGDGKVRVVVQRWNPGAEQPRAVSRGGFDG
jgi:outer membrane lipoprotein LolB